MRSKNGCLGKHDTTIVSQQFGVKIRTVQRIWERGKNQLAQNIPVKVPNLKKGRSGRKAIPIDLEELRNIPLQQRMTLEDVSSRLGVSKTRIHKFLKKGMLRHHSSSVRPYLTEANKNTRLKWCIDMIDQSLFEIQSSRICLTLCLLMRSGSISIKNRRGTTCYPMKMNHIVFAKIRTTFLGSCFYVLLLGQDLEMEYVCLMGR
jgi:hypothetical protein